MTWNHFVWPKSSCLWGHMTLVHLNPVKHKLIFIWPCCHRWEQCRLRVSFSVRRTVWKWRLIFSQLYPEFSDNNLSALVSSQGDNPSATKNVSNAVSITMQTYVVHVCMIFKYLVLFCTFVVVHIDECKTPTFGKDWKLLKASNQWVWNTQSVFRKADQEPTPHGSSYRYTCSQV